MASAQHHVQSGLRTDQARRALGAAGTGQQAQLDLWQTQAGVGEGHAVMRCQRHFQPAAQRCAVDGGQHWLAADFDAIAQFGQQGRLRRFAEFADVGPADEVAARAGHQDGGHAGIGFAFLDGGHQAPAHRHPQRIDRWVVDGYHQDGTFTRQMDRGRFARRRGLLGHAAVSCSSWFA